MLSSRLVIVVGSVNVDYVMRLGHRPAPGETVRAHARSDWALTTIV
jgi:sugar/nucleoside kinase (ribokinase family)